MEQIWLNNYDNVKSQIQLKRKTGLPISPNETRAIIEAIQKLEKDLRTIQDAPMEYEISSSEISRRQIILENLKKSFSMVGSSSTSTRNSNPNFGQETSNPLTLSDKGLIQRQKEVIEDQDRVLEQIEKGVGRLHSQALEIGNEAKIHVKIIEDLDKHVDVATQGLQEETKHAEQIRRKSQVCYMYICIVVEIVVLLILVILTFAHI